mgnify:CR=1 FL=1
MSDIAKWNGIAVAGIAKWNGIAVAGVAKYNGFVWPSGGPPPGGEWLQWDYDAFDPLTSDFLTTQIFE